jgi:hypothetical protein
MSRIKITAISSCFLITVLENRDLALADALRTMKTCTQLCTEVRSAIPVMRWLDFKGYEKDVHAADVLRAVHMHGPSKHLRGVDMRFLWRIHIFQIQSILDLIDARVPGVSIGDAFASKDRMRVSMRLVRDSQRPRENELWLQVSNPEPLHQMQAQAWENDETRQRAVFFSQPDECGPVGAFVRTALAVCDPAHALEKGQKEQQASILNVLRKHTCTRSKDKAKSYDVFLGYAETESGLLGCSHSSTQLFYTTLLKQQHQIDDFQKVLDKIPWLLASPVAKALEQNLERVPRLDARVAAILPFEVADIPKTGFENTDIHELSRFFKIQRNGQQHTLEEVIKNQRVPV